MKFSSQEEYGLRCILRIARDGGAKGLTIPEISQAEKLSIPNVGKLLRILRIGGFLESSRGQTGGYALTRKPEEIFLADVLNVLGGRLYDNEFCNTHSGIESICSNSIDCSIRSLWQLVQNSVDEVTTKISLKDILGSGSENMVTKIEMYN
ncbi:MAG: RrF2 family transcriptional regulator [Ignavibacteria bacterium]